MREREIEVAVTDEPLEHGDLDPDEWIVAGVFTQTDRWGIEAASAEEAVRAREAFRKFIEFLEWSKLPRIRRRYVYDFIDLWDDCTSPDA